MHGTSPAMPALGLLAGLLLLGFAGVLMVGSAGDHLVGAGAKEFLSPRRLQFGYITTSKAPSSFDSSDFSSSGSSLEPSKSFMSGSMESSDWQYVWPQMSRSIGGTMGWLTLSLALQLVFAAVYNNYVVQSIKDEVGKLDELMQNGYDASGSGGDFQNGMFECYKDKWVCCTGLCCPMVRIAHTNAVSGVCPFWESLCCWCCCSWLTMNIGPFCLLMWWRLRLKSIMRVEDNPVNDFCITMFCPAVSICQMSTAVDSAMGYQMSNCIGYSPYGYGGPMADQG